MADELTLEELSARTGEPEEGLRRWRELGLIGSEGSDAFSPKDVERVRLVQLFLRRGIGLEAIQRAFQGDVVKWHVDVLAASGPTYSLAEAAEIAGIDLGTLRRLWKATGFDEELHDEDVEAIKRFKAAQDAGFPEEAMMQLVRVFHDSLGKVAEMEARLFHFHIHERLKSQGLSGRELVRATNAVGEQTTPLIEPVILYFHRKGWERAVREDAALHVAEEAGLLAVPDVPGQVTRAMAFIDLSSFTPLAEAMGDAKAAEVLERFSALVRESAARWDGRVVKQIGDAFMLVFPDARSAVACTMEAEAKTSDEPSFPAARAGIHWGQVLYREGDYVGSSVNIAARVAAEAERHQVLVTAAVRNESKGLPDVEFVPLGKRRLKGLASELVLFEARAAGAQATEQHIDPVCGMEMGPDEVAARLTLEGMEHAFCSDECLRRYVATPEKYST
jgi:class 3 adenylate cyclase/YHS domain-containing protein